MTSQASETSGPERVDGANPGAGAPELPAPRGVLADTIDGLRSRQSVQDDRLGYQAPSSTPRRDPAHYERRRRVSPPWRARYTGVLVIGDLLIALVSAVIGLAIEPVDGRPDAAITATFGAVFMALLTIGRAYEHRFIAAGGEEFRRVAVAGVILMASTSTIAYAAQAHVRGLVLLAAPLTLIGSLLWHAVVRQVLYALRRRGRCVRRVVVIGLERSVDELVQRLRREPQAGLHVVAACVSAADNATIAGVPVAGAPSDVRSVARRQYADTIVLTAWSDVSEQELQQLSWQIEGSGYDLFVAPRIIEVAPPRMHLQPAGGVPLLHVDEPEFTGMRRVAKKLLDVVLTSGGLVLLSPLLVMVAIAVKVSSPGPVLFRQERVGKHSQTFLMTKFRTMYVDAEERLAELQGENEHGEGPLFKMRSDPRVTKVGAVLRKFSLDELPQLFDVLRGEMSLVGPRPPLPREVAAYERDVHRRLLVKPGITGLWQVSGRSDLTWEESVRLDLSYVENWSLALDLTIIARTVVAVLAQRGAY